MSGVRVVGVEQLTWGQIPGTSGGIAQIGEVVSGKESQTIGAGFTRLENTSMSRELQYDEVVYVIEGAMTIAADGVTQVARPGQVVHLPKGSRTSYTFEEPTLLFYAIYPNNWADLI